MSNVHTPERQTGESQAEYRQRQARSRAANKLRDAAGFVIYPGKQTSRELQRDTKRNNGTLRGIYGIGLLQPQRQRNERRMCALHPLRDDNGVYTLTGFHGDLPEIVGYDAFGECIVEMRQYPRRIWLAGISAQRGY